MPRSRFALRQLHRARQRLLPLISGAGVAGLAIAAVAYLLWPTWQTAGAAAPNRIPVNVGDTLFNVPAHAFRIKVQTHSGSQDRVDLAFLYPSLQAPDHVRHVTADTVEEGPPPIDRLFLSIVANTGVLAPEVRARTVYPRYLEPTTQPAADGLTLRAFRINSPYAGEDLAVAEGSRLIARCSRDAATIGMCLSERRSGTADLTFRFPRAWLSEWREVARGMDRLTVQLRDPKAAAD